MAQGPGLRNHSGGSGFAPRDGSASRPGFRELLRVAETPSRSRDDFTGSMWLVRGGRDARSTPVATDRGPLSPRLKLIRDYGAGAGGAEPPADLTAGRGSA